MALVFTNASTDKIDWGSALNGGSTLDPLTLAFWARQQNWNTFHSMFANDGGTNYFYVSQGSTDGELAFVFKRSTSDDRDDNVATGLTDTSDWYFCVVTYDSSASSGQRITVYTGDLSTQVSQQVQAGTGSGTHNNSGGTFRYGETFGTGGGFHLGWCGVWNRVLSLGEIQAQQWNPHVTSGCRLFNWGYDSTNLIDLSGHGHTATETGTVTESGDQVPLAPSFGRRWERWGSGHIVAAPALSIPVAMSNYRQRQQLSIG